jgi:DNA primase
MASDTRAQVLAATDLAKLVGETVALKRRGRDFVGLCPFHAEKTPSFHVNPAKQYFICFGCKASGTAFDFIMRRDRVEFREALEILARRAGIDIPRFGGEKAKPGERQLLLDIHQAAARFFENQLSQPLGQAARDYLAQRGFLAETLRQFRVGLAPPGWDSLLRSEVGRKFGAPALALAGLVKPGNSGGHYDTFRARIMFPIRDGQGQTIAFGGRVLPGSDDPAKYLNSPETPLFSKGRAVFGLHAGRQKIVESRTAAVVEGYTDVMMAHQFGATNVVSVLGTAVTEQHVNLLRRSGADRIVLLFDADSAGDAAVERVVQLFLTQPVEICVATMPAGLDPDEFLLQHGLAGMEQLLAGAQDGLSYAWKQMFRRLAAAETDLVAREQATRNYLQLLTDSAAGGEVDTIRWGSALARVARLTALPVEELHRRFRPRRRGAVAGTESAPTEAPAGIEQAQRHILAALLLEPGRWPAVQAVVDPAEFPPGPLRRLAEVYWQHQQDEGEPVFHELLAELGDPDLVSLAIELAETAQRLQDAERMIDGALAFLEQERQRRRQREMQTLAEDQRHAPGDAQAQLLRLVQEKARQPDIRRLGS